MSPTLAQLVEHMTVVVLLLVSYGRWFDSSKSETIIITYSYSYYYLIIFGYIFCRVSLVFFKFIRIVSSEQDINFEIYLSDLIL